METSLFEEHVRFTVQNFQRLAREDATHMVMLQAASI
jgi:hypothetical protein